MKILSLLSFIFVTLTCQSQTTYTGFVDKYPIQLVTHIYSDGDARAIYAYDKFDTPILIPGKLKGNRLELNEKDDKGKIQARLIFKNFSQTSDKILGEWINADSTKRLKITLTKQFDFDNNDNTTWINRELLQQESTPTHYFKLLISNDGPENDARVTGVRILEKKNRPVNPDYRTGLSAMGIRKSPGR